MFSITKGFDTDLDKAETSQVSQITLDLQRRLCSQVFYTECLFQMHVHIQAKISDVNVEAAN